MTTFMSGCIVGGMAGLLMGWHYARRNSRSTQAAFTPSEENVQQLKAAHAAVAERTSRRLDRIVAAAQAAGHITNDGVEDLFCISDRTASTYLRILSDTNRLTRHGVGRGTYYVPVK